MAQKIGLDEPRPDDVALFNELEKMLRAIQPDMTIFFHLLASAPTAFQNGQEAAAHFSESFYQPLTEPQLESLTGWLQQYATRISSNTISVEMAKEKMQQANPQFILRNYLLHQAIEELQNGEDGLFRKLQEAIKHPYEARYPELWGKRPSWASQKAGCSMLSCSS
jgi:uncharacterized protein YdiU (UPF0061 family)